VPLPTVIFVALILLDEFVLPYHGGGASMWPLALLFGIPTALAGSVLGTLIALVSRLGRQANDAL